MVIHVTIYGHMQLESLKVQALLVTVHVLLIQDDPLLHLLAKTITVNLEQEVVGLLVLITYPTHCGMVQVVLLTIHVVPTLTNHGSIIS